MMAKTDDEQKEAKFELEDLREQFDTLKYEYRDVVGGVRTKKPYNHCKILLSLPLN